MPELTDKQQAIRPTQCDAGLGIALRRHAFIGDA